jgi:predicted metal-dependent phosphoesterase TrpH
MDENRNQIKILSFEEAEIFRKQGWKAADLHVHTLCSPDVISAKPMHPEALYKRAREIGMDFVTFTDHDTMEAYDLLGDNLKEIVTGVEIKIKDLEVVGHTIHVNVYDLCQEQFYDLEEIAKQNDLRGFLDYLMRKGLPFIYNHPLWFEPKEKPNLSSIPDLIKLFPVLEYNMQRVNRKNEIVIELAKRYRKGLAASTDSHSGGLGAIYTLARGDCFRDFFENICNGNSYIVVKDLTKQDLVREMNRWIELIFSRDMFQEAKEYSTGFGYLDKMINILTSKNLRSFPTISSAAKQASYRISRSGLPALSYLRYENSLLPELEKQLRINVQIDKLLPPKRGHCLIKTGRRSSAEPKRCKLSISSRQ